MTDAAAPAETPADAPQAAEAADTPAATPEAATDAHDGAEVVEDQDADADVFPRHVIEKLRRENANFRDRAKAAEQTVIALQRQQVEARAAAAGLKPAALWAVTKLDDVLDADGTPDPAKLHTAMQTARETLGVGLQQRRQKAPVPGGGGDLKSGSGVPHEPRNSWAAAFAPKKN